MTLDEFCLEMESDRRDADGEAHRLKDPWIALERLRNLFGRFDETERTMADQVLTQWALSDDENLRFDAIAMIRDFRVMSAIPALRQLEIRLKSSAAPGARYELEKVSRLIEEFTTDGHFE